MATFSQLLKRTTGRDVKASRPSDYGLAPARIAYRAGRKDLGKQMKRIARKKMAEATTEIINCFKKKWESLLPHETKSVNALASALINRGIVTQYSSPFTLIKLLNRLLKKNKISLPRRKGKIRTWHK